MEPASAADRETAFAARAAAARVPHGRTSTADKPGRYLSTRRQALLQECTVPRRWNRCCVLRSCGAASANFVHCFAPKRRYRSSDATFKLQQLFYQQFRGCSGHNVGVVLALAVLADIRYVHTAARAVERTDTNAEGITPTYSFDMCCLQAHA